MQQARDAVSHRLRRHDDRVGYVRGEPSGHLHVEAACSRVAPRDPEERDVVDRNDAARADGLERQRVVGRVEDVDSETVEQTGKAELLPPETARSRSCWYAIDAPVALRCGHLVEPWPTREDG